MGTYAKCITSDKLPDEKMTFPFEMQDVELIFCRNKLDNKVICAHMLLTKGSSTTEVCDNQPQNYEQKVSMPLDGRLL